MATNKTKIILFDLDETIIYSEELKTQAWNSILKPWGYHWGKNKLTNRFKRVPQESRPKTGIHPHAFIGQLIDKLELQISSLDFKNKTGTYLPLLKSNKHKGKKVLITIMLAEWRRCLVQEAQKVAAKGKIVEVSGAVKIIKRFHKNGYKIGVVTQAPFEYAHIILKSLGLISSEAKVTDKLLIRGNNIIDVIVSGEEVKYPKPNPEALLIAADMINKKTDVISFPYAMIGDSESDMLAGKALDIVTVLINSRGLSHSELGTFSHDIVINSFFQLSTKMLDEAFLKKRRKLVY